MLFAVVVKFFAFFRCLELNGLFAIVCRRTKSTPDPDASEKYRDAPPMSIAMLLQIGRKSYICHQSVSRYASHSYRVAFAEVFGSEVVGTPQSQCEGGHRSVCCRHAPQLLRSVPSGTPPNHHRKFKWVNFSHYHRGQKDACMTNIFSN